MLTRTASPVALGCRMATTSVMAIEVITTLTCVNAIAIGCPLIVFTPLAQRRGSRQGIIMITAGGKTMETLPIRTEAAFDALPPGSLVLYDEDGFEMVVTLAPSGIADGRFQELAFVDGSGAAYSRRQILAGSPRVWIAGGA